MPSNGYEILIFFMVTIGIIFLLMTLFVWMIFLYRKRQLIYQQNLQNLKLDYEKNLLKTQVEIQEQTFQDISREIHDNINLSLTLAKLNLNMLDWNDLAKAEESIKSSVQIIGTAITNLSDISKSMNPELISNQGLIKALENEVIRIQNTIRIPINLQITGEPVFMESEKELVIFRIIQEAFNNIIKHARATLASVTLHYELEQVEILIKDNGIGFEHQGSHKCRREGKAGLNNMQTRAQLFNGSLMVQSIPQKGTQVLVTIPI